MLEADLIVIIPVTWRGMHETRARIIGDMVACKKFDLKIPFAIRALSAAQGMGAGQEFQFQSVHVSQAAIHQRLEPHRTERILGQFISYEIAIAHLGPTFVRGGGDLVKPVGNLRPKTNRAVLRNGPGSGCPDDDFGIFQHTGDVFYMVSSPNLQFLRSGFQIGEVNPDNLKRHPNRIGLAVVIFHFRLGQCGLFNRRPHDGLRALVKRAVHQEFHKLARDHRLGVEIHGEVGLVPIPRHA